MCTVFGVCGHPEAAKFCRDGMHTLQHRGQDSVGIAVADSHDSSTIQHHKALGVAIDVFPPGSEAIESLKGDIAVGHDRYSTAGTTDLICAQPHVINDPLLAFAQNGDVPPGPYTRARRDLQIRMKDCFALKTANDGELEANFLAAELRQGNSVPQAVKKMMEEVPGAFSAVMLYDDKMYAFRDPLGIRPLCLGEGDEGGWYAVASEDCAFGAIGAHYLRDVRPGELLMFSPGQLPESMQLVENKNPRQCIFEMIYFSLPSSNIFGMSVSHFRRLLGRALAASYSVSANVVIGIPDSSTKIALGYSETSGVTYDIGLVRSHYVGRTFITDKQAARDDKAKRKFSPDRRVLNGQKVIVIDDSIVRATTTRRLVRMIFNNGAEEVHLRIGSPPTKCSCHYGIATPDEAQLIASYSTIPQILDFVSEGLSKNKILTLEYLDMEDLRATVSAFGKNPNHFCYACFDGNYPTPIV